jgi:hypothetical protein
VIRPGRASRIIGAIRLGVAIAVAVSVAPTPAHATVSCPTPPEARPELGAISSTRRLGWIEDRLTDAEHKARLWEYGWVAGIGAAGIASLAAVPFVAPENRVDWYTGAVSAGVGVATLLVVTPVVLDAAPALRAEVARAAPADLCPVLRLAESDLVRVAQDEERQGRWYVHLGNVLFNVGLGLFLGLGYHHWEAGAVNAAAGIAVGEALILTRPRAAIHDLDTYRAGAFSAPRSP